MIQREKVRKMSVSVEIIPFHESHQDDVDLIMDSIAAEFEENIYSSQFRKLKEIAVLRNHMYWCAAVAGKVVGTIGLCALENRNVELKRLFLLNAFRGKGVSKALMEKALLSAQDNKHSCMYLGTMNQFKAAQAFYEKNGFEKIARVDLPHDFQVNPVDKVFYKRQL
jgi:GNAT superfamily N-acetyltransferase